MAGRIEIDDVAPVVSGGRFPAKAVVGEVVPVKAVVWREGHDAVAATLVVRYHGTAYPRLAKAPAGVAPPQVEAVPIDEVVGSSPKVKRQHLPMSPGRTPDVFHGQFIPDAVGLWTFRVDGWGDPLATWRKNVTAKLEAGQGESELSNDLLLGAQLLERAATGVPRQDRYPLIEAAAQLREPGDPFARAGAALSPEVADLLHKYPLRELVTRDQQYGVWVDRPLARFSAWYEMFPRSTGGWDGQGRRGPRHVRHRQQGTAPHREDGLRHRLPAADPPDRQGAPQGPQQQRDRGAEGRGVAVGDRQQQGRPRRRASRPRHHRGLRRLRRRRARRGPRGRPGPGAAVRTGSPVGQGPSRVVHRAARRHHRLRGEPAEEVPGHLPGQLRQRSGRHLPGGAARRPVLDLARRQGLPGRQSAHQAAELLGVADRRGEERRSRRAVPG